MNECYSEFKWDIIPISLIIGQCECFSQVYRIFLSGFNPITTLLSLNGLHESVHMSRWELRMGYFGPMRRGPYKLPANQSQEICDETSYIHTNGILMVNSAK